MELKNQIFFEYHKIIFSNILITLKFKIKLLIFQEETDTLLLTMEEIKKKHTDNIEKKVNLNK